MLPNTSDTQHNTRQFLRIASVCAFATAVTTFLLWLLPTLYTAPADFGARVLLRYNDYYMARLWVNFIHIPLALMGYFGLMLILFRKRPAMAVFGMIWFLVWGVIEITGISGILFSVNYHWRTEYALADDLAKRTLKTNIETYYSVWDSMFFVLLIAFLLGSVFFGWASWKSRGLEKLLSCLLWLAVPLTLLIILSNYAGQDWAEPVTGYIYPVLQPLSRFVLGIFLWKSATGSIRAIARDGRE